MKKSFLQLCVLFPLFLVISCNGGKTDPVTPTPTPTPPTPEEEEGVVPKHNPTDKRLYNGITLPDVWPPKNSTTNVTAGMNPDYLKNKPSSINITYGRQLFVDDFLIAETSLSRKWYQANYSDANPVLQPEKEWEMTDDAGAGCAAPFSDGVWYDEVDGKYKMWYMAKGNNSNAGYCATCYAESVDGINWTRPSLNVSPGTNIVYQGLERDSNTIWLDKEASKSSERYKMFNVIIGSNGCQYHYFTSSNGTAWREQVESQKIADRSTAFYNPFRGTWVWSLRHNIRVDASTLVRARDYMENPDPLQGTKNAVPNLNDFWFGSWPSDPRHPNYPSVVPGIYNMDAIAYESVLLGVFSVWSGPENDVCARDKVIKTNQLMLGYSRDGWSWYRGDFVPFCPINASDKSAWNHGNIQSAVGSPLIVGDKLYFYMSGRRFNANGKEVISTGLATLRRDGFASMSGTGNLTTEPLVFKGKYFYVNADIKGSMKVEILDANGNGISGFSAADCIAVTGDGTKMRVQWKDNKTLESLDGKQIRVKFHVENGDLYAFWISRYEDGRSYGYTAGGGPGLNKNGIDF